MPRARLFPVVILLLTLLSGHAVALGFEGFSVELAQAWTGNGYVPTPNDPGGTYDFDVTGSERTPIDTFVGFAARIGLLDGFIGERNVLSVMPGIEFGIRRYVLFESGIVVPTQIETATGAEGNTLGRGSASVLTIRVPLPVAYEIRFANRSSLFMSLSPTLVARIRIGGIALRDDNTDLSGMDTYFYEDLRFLMPEVALGFRFPVSDYLESTVRATYGVSVLDLFDTSLPWYDKTRASISISLGFVPPFGGLFRDREETQRLPRGVDPDPDV